MDLGRGGPRGRPVPEQLTSFGAERTIERTISREPERIATAWLSTDLMIGAQRSSGEGRPSSQFHPVTMHWRNPDGDVAWLRLRGHRLDAEASAGRLSLTATDAAAPSAFVFEVSPTEVGKFHIGADRWELPGLTLDVDTNGTLAEVAHDEGGILVRYAPPGEGRESVVFTVRG